MNPVIFQLGPLALRPFTLWLAFGVALIALVILFPIRRQKSRLLPWLDVLVGVVVLGTIGARLGHIGLNWDYFSTHTNEIISITSGGLDWHGALIAGIIGGLIIASLRRLPWLTVLDAFALAIPIGACAVWLACLNAPAAYGVEVRTLADFPSWLVIESPDIYGIVAPRLNLVPPGILLALLVGLLVVVLALSRRLIGLRLWLAIILYSFGMAFIDFFRTEYVPIWLGHRADQILDLVVAFLATIGLCLIILLRHKMVPFRQDNKRTDGTHSVATPSLPESAPTP